MKEGDVAATGKAVHISIGSFIDDNEATQRAKGAVVVEINADSNLSCATDTTLWGRKYN